MDTQFNPLSSGNPSEVFILNKMKRSEAIKKAPVEVLDKVKTLVGTPVGKNMVYTFDQIAYFYETEVDTVKKSYQRHSDEFSDTMTKVLKKSELGTQGHHVPALFKGKNTTIRIFGKRAVLLFGLNLKDSIIAKQVRQAVLDIVEQKQEEIISASSLSEDQIVLMARMIVKNAEEKKKLEQENNLLKPKADSFDQLMSNDGLVKIEDVAKTLGVRGLGRNKLFEFLRDKNILFNASGKRNHPYQLYVNDGWFVLRMREVTYPNGTTGIQYTTMVKPKGVEKIRKLVNERFGK